MVTLPRRSLLFPFSLPRSSSPALLVSRSVFGLRRSLLLLPCFSLFFSFSALCFSFLFFSFLFFSFLFFSFLCFSFLFFSFLYFSFLFFSFLFFSFLFFSFLFFSFLFFSFLFFSFLFFSFLFFSFLFFSFLFFSFLFFPFLSLPFPSFPFLSFSLSCPGPVPFCLVLWSCSLLVLFFSFLFLFSFLFFPSFLLRRLCVFFACWGGGLAPVSRASFFVVLWAPPLPPYPNVCDLEVFVPLVEVGLLFVAFPSFALLLRPALGYAAWFNTSVYFCPLLGLQPGSTYVPSATYVFAPGFASLIPRILCILLWTRSDVRSDCYPLLSALFSISHSSQRVGFHQLSLRFCHFRVDAHFGRFEVPVHPSASLWNLVAPCFQCSFHLRESLLTVSQVEVLVVGNSGLTLALCLGRPAASELHQE